jgi:hypothetical protein
MAKAERATRAKKRAAAKNGAGGEFNHATVHSHDVEATKI